MRYIVLGAVAAVALAATAGTAAAQHGGRHGHGYPAHSPVFSGHGGTGHYTPSHHQWGGHVVHPGGGYYAVPSRVAGVGVVTGPAYYPAYPYPVTPGHNHGYGPYSHHGRHH